MRPVDITLARARIFLSKARPRLAPIPDESVFVEKTIWSSPAGKKMLAPKLVKLITPHKTYVEPFAGSGAVYFEKEPVETDVLSDANPEISSAYKSLKSLSDKDLAALGKKSWTGNERAFKSLYDSKPQGKLEKLYRFLYVTHFSYGKMRGRSFNPNADGVEANVMKRIEKHRDRLKHLTIRSGDYEAVVKEFDSKNTFFFLDPPYPGHNVKVGEDKFDEAKFRKVLDGIKGRFLITYGTRGELDTKGFQVKKIRTPRTIRSMRGVGGPKTLAQLLITNFGFANKSLGEGDDQIFLDDVEGVELDDGVAADLEHASALVNALMAKNNEPLMKELADELELIDAMNGETGALERELVSVGKRLVIGIEKTMPDISKAFAQTVAAFDKPKENKEQIEKMLDRRIQLLKTADERYVLGVVLEPETVDAQQDIYSAAEVREAAHKFMEEYRNVGLMHREIINGKAKIVESYLTPTEVEIDGTKIKKGTWLLGVHVLDDELWKQIKEKEIGGLSIGGSASRQAS